MVGWLLEDARLKSAPRDKFLDSTLQQLAMICCALQNFQSAKDIHKSGIIFLGKLECKAVHIHPNWDLTEETEAKSNFYCKKNDPLPVVTREKFTEVPTWRYLYNDWRLFWIGSREKTREVAPYDDWQYQLEDMPRLLDRILANQERQYQQPTEGRQKKWYCQLKWWLAGNGYQHHSIPGEAA